MAVSTRVSQYVNEVLHTFAKSNTVSIFSYLVIFLRKVKVRPSRDDSGESI